MANPAQNIEHTLTEIGSVIRAQSNSIRFLAGTKIFDMGDPGDFAYMIDTGYVEISSISAGSKNILAVLGPGEIFGEMALIDGRPRCATALAMHAVKLIPIPRDQLLQELDLASPIARIITIASISRLRALQMAGQPEPDQNTITVAKPHQEAGVIDAVRMSASQQLKLRFDLERAIAKEQFSLVYQPILSLNDGRLAGIEALVRWPNSTGPVVMPDKFIPIAEQSGMIVPLGSWVLKSALQALTLMEQKLSREHPDSSGIFVSVNVSPRQLENEENVEQLATLIERSTINPDRIKLEITEQALLLDPRMATIGLARLKATGASIAIDDFGTGYSSLSYLHRFPLDTLKIDRSFISRIVEDKNRQRIVAAIISLARELDLDVVAEGVEELDEANWLRSQACSYAQGYLISKPVPIGTAMGFLDRHFEF
ncbi:MAG: EAL domain-containing protein [Granulosicoccus sp.]